MRLIVEHTEDGEVFAYFENKTQYRRNKRFRISKNKLDRTQLAHNCLMPPDSYVVVKVKKGEAR